MRSIARAAAYACALPLLVVGIVAMLLTVRLVAWLSDSERSTAERAREAGL